MVPFPALFARVEPTIRSRIGDGPVEMRSMLAYETFRAVLGPAVEMFFGVKAEGADNVPESDGALLVANHRCYLDPIVLAMGIERFVNFAAGSHLYKFPGASHIFRYTGFFRMDIYGGEGGDQSLDNASRLLRNGELVGIFPEGIEAFMDVSNVSRILAFKTGFAKLALENRVPIVPAAIVAHSEREFPHVPGPLITPFVKHPRAPGGITLITYRGVTCRIGRPIDLSPYYDEVFSKDLIDHIAGRVRRIIIKLYDGEMLDKLLWGTAPFDFVNDRV